MRRSKFRSLDPSKMRLAAMIAGAALLAAACDRAPIASNPPPAAPGGSNATHATGAVPETAAVLALTNMVPIPAGTFMRIRYPVTISYNFWMGKYEVTQGEYEAVVGKNPSKFTGDPNLPVEKVTHLDAERFCELVTRREREARHIPETLEYRLPTEAEWEYACRAGTTNLFSFGDNAAEAARYAWTDENSEAKTHPVGLKEPNAWGLYDMHGNVWEWVSDWFAPYPAMALTNTAGPSTSKFKVFRGGGWNNEIQMARASNRFMMAQTNGIHFVGFRMVLGPPKK